MAAVLAAVTLALCLPSTPGAFAQSNPDTLAMEMAVSDDPRGAIKRADEALAPARASGNKVAELAALRLLTKALEQVEEAPRLKVAIERGFVLAKELGHEEAVCEFLAHQGSLSANDGQFVEATRRFDEAIEHAERHNLRAVRAKVQAAKGHMYLTLGRVSDALGLLVEAHAFFETHHEKLWMSNTLSLMANAFGRDGRDKEGQAKAIEYNKRAMALMDPKTNRYDLATDYHNLGVDYARSKDYATARDYFTKSRVLAEQLQDPVSLAYLDFRMGLIDREEKRYAKALVGFERAIPVFADIGNSNMQFMATLARAKTLSLTNRRREAVESLSRARLLADRLNTPANDTTYYETASEIHATVGDWEKAYKATQQLRDAERRASDAANAQLAAELEQRFDSKQKEADNAVLRARQLESDARRIALVLALVLSLTALGGAAFYLVRQRQRNRQYEALAMRDDLTQLPNRRSILEFARLQFRRRRESDGGFCLALLDIDHFKSINDEFGHAIGDAVLVAFAQACQNQLRSNDRLGRFGGEEFLLVMPGSDAGQIPQVFERLRAAVRHLAVPGLPASRRLTFSLGGAANQSPVDTLDDLIKRADRAMYRAKEGGRDRFEIGAGA
jgi:diguanylate cyclase (GGDEF)-like protein